MRIIKKIGKFIASRALYLALGVFLAAGVTYVYATWDDARTLNNLNPDELTRDNWNELVTMIESEIGGGSCYVSYIDDPTDAACLAGFTNNGSVGTWGTCNDAAGTATCGRAHFRPQGGSCYVGWNSYTVGTAYVCCQ